METVAALLEPGERTLGWIVAPSYSLTEKIFTSVATTLRSHFPTRIREYSPRDHRISIVNLGGGASELKAKSADRPDGLLGEALDFLVVDECASVRNNTWDEYLAPRLIDRDGWALLVSTPHGRGWFYQQWKRGRNGRDADYESWQAPTTANPHVALALIEAERAWLDPERFAEQYEAQFSGPPEPCDVCGGPSPDGSGLMVRCDEPRYFCTECGRQVDRNGRTVVTIWGDREAPVHELDVATGTDIEDYRTIYRDFGPGGELPEGPLSAWVRAE